MAEAEESNFGVAAISLLIAVNNSAPSPIDSLLNDVPQVQYKGK